MYRYYIAYQATDAAGRRCSSHSIVASTTEASQDTIRAAVERERPGLTITAVTAFQPA